MLLFYFPLILSQILENLRPDGKVFLLSSLKKIFLKRFLCSKIKISIKLQIWQNVGEGKASQPGKRDEV